MAKVMEAGLGGGSVAWLPASCVLAGWQAQLRLSTSVTRAQESGALPPATGLPSAAYTGTRVGMGHSLVCPQKGSLEVPVSQSRWSSPDGLWETGR